MKIEEGHQARLPHEFRDRTALNDIELQIEDADYRELNMTSAETFENRIIVRCGRHIQFANISDLKPIDTSSNTSPTTSEFHVATINFDNNFEIDRLRAVDDPN